MLCSSPESKLSQFFPMFFHQLFARLFFWLIFWKILADILLTSHVQMLYFFLNAVYQSLGLNFHNSFPSSFSNFLCFRLICGKTLADILLTSHGSTNEAWDSPTIFSDHKDKDHQQIFLQFRNFNQIWESMWSRCLEMNRIVWSRWTYSSNILNFSVFQIFHDR